MDGLYSRRAGGRRAEHGDAGVHARFQFIYPILKMLNPKKKVSTKLKFSKSRSCRGTITLQLPQWATYVLVHGLTAKM
jgi:hypothetical protein